MNVQPEQWVESAGGRAAWMLWGKARPEAPDALPGHPLLCHMLDVASVAARMTTTVVPPRAARQLLSAFDAPPELAARSLAYLVALHDLGKASPAFQAKHPGFARALTAAGFDFVPYPSARDHGTLTAVLVRDLLFSAHRVPGPTAARIARSLAAHHGEFPSDDRAWEEPGRRELGASLRWAEARQGVARELASVWLEDGLRLRADVARTGAWLGLLAGITAVADWVGSNAEVFAYAATSCDAKTYATRIDPQADEALRRAGLRPNRPRSTRSFADLFGFEPRPLQAAAIDTAARLDGPSLVLVEAPMGDGKTEAALYLADHAEADGARGTFVALPTQATANQMLARVERFLRSTRPDEPSSLVLAHGDAMLEEGFRRLCAAVYDPGDGGAVRAESWFLGRKRTLLADHAVGTVDQALLGVLRVGHGFVRLFGLAGKTVVVDEVHAYDTYTSSLLERWLVWLRSLGANVVLLSATLPRARRAALLATYGAAETVEVAYPRVSVATSGGSWSVPFAPRQATFQVQLERLVDDADALVRRVVEEVAEGGCVGVLCNTVARAQDVYRRLELLLEAVGHGDTPMLLVHARLLPRARRSREAQLHAWLGPRGERPHRCIVVGTQVLEQSLDVDFDWMITDLAPIDLVLQRSGRLHRHAGRIRPARFERPRLGLVEPVDDLAAVAGVYDELIVRRTQAALASRESLRMPDELAPLVEAVYDLESARTDSTWGAVLAEYEQEHEGQRLQAMHRLLPLPGDRDPFANFRVYARDEEDPSLHDDLRALTRLGDPTVDIVCLHEVPGGLALEPDGSDPVDLERAPTLTETRALAERRISVSRRSLVRSLLATAVPSGWRSSPILRHARALRFRDGRCEMGRDVLILDEELGLCVERRSA